MNLLAQNRTATSVELARAPIPRKTTRVFGVGIVGAGRIGGKRARVVSRCPEAQLRGVVDQDPQRSQALVRQYGGDALRHWEDLVRRRDIDVVIVATTHNWLAPITRAALESHKHVLCEKPLAMTSRDAKQLVDLADRYDIKLKTGFNHRHHPALVEAHRLVEDNAIGRLLFLRCRYGHGGRAGYETEWRANPTLSGGGELMDQAIHILDLFRWFAGEFKEIHAALSYSFWQMPVEDNAFCTLRSRGGAVATLHASWTQWKNLFSFEAFGEDGYVTVDGLGGSYGREKLVVGRRPPKFGRPRETVREFVGEDSSWDEEWKEFLSAIRENRRPLADGTDGWQALRLVEAGYRSAQEGRVIDLRSTPCRTATTSSVS